MNLYHPFKQNYISRLFQQGKLLLVIAIALLVRSSQAQVAITSQPQNQVIPIGGMANFSVAASGTAPLSYQWQLNGTNQAGLTNATLTLTNISLVQAGSYRAIVTNTTSAATSSPAILFVVDPAPSVSGQWSSVMPWPSLAIHLHLLPTGKVMFWDRSDASMGWNGTPMLWDPATQLFTNLPMLYYDIFCSGHTFMADGRLMVIGGHVDNGVGQRHASLYDAYYNAWLPLPDMNEGRWYPTATTLANGDVLAMAGTATGYGDINVYPQVWKNTNCAWGNLNDGQQGYYPNYADFYPWMFQAPNGKIFDAGPAQTARYLDVSGTGNWIPVASSSLSYRDYGTAVMYDDGKVLITGGNPRDDLNFIKTILPSAITEVIDLNAPTPAWRTVTPMSIGRRQLTSTLLPDGTVLVTGGSSVPGFDTSEGAVLYPEIWNPVTEIWTPMSSATRYRGYHSTALLLPDGRVVVAGGGHPDSDAGPQTNAEFFSPPYLFKGPRPTIASAPPMVLYGQKFSVATPDALNITNVNWIRLGSVTHAFNQNQRINHLSFTRAAGSLTVNAPTNQNLCTPGHYLLFILNTNGVPSVARIIQIAPKNPAVLDIKRLTNSLVLSWPANASGFVLQGTTNISNPNGWLTVTNGIDVICNPFLYTNSTPGGNLFYRLIKQ